jgi:hypothetical protein
VLCWLATVDADGQPNVSPKEIFCAYGTDTLLIADIASPVSVRNILANPKVCVSVVDVFRQHGWKLSGSARVIERTDPAFSVTGAELLAMAGPDFIIRHLISVTLTKASRIQAPSYLVFPERTEQDQIRRAYQTYKVWPA